MAKKGVVALMACVFALCLALVGCGGSGSGDNAANNKAAFVGTWDLVEMSQDGEVTSSDDLETLKALGMEVYVNLNEDDTMVIAMFGDPIEGTWEATSTTTGTAEMEGRSFSISIADEKLTFEQEGSRLTFEKGEAKEAPTASSDDESATTEEEAGESTEATAEEAGESVEATEEEAGEAASESAEAAEESSESESAEAEASEETSESESSSSSESESSSSSAAA